MCHHRPDRRIRQRCAALFCTEHVERMCEVGSGVGQRAVEVEQHGAHRKRSGMGRHARRPVMLASACNATPDVPWMRTWSTMVVAMLFFSRCALFSASPCSPLPLLAAVCLDGMGQI